jgi:hypothetical protein
MMSLIKRPAERKGKKSPFRAAEKTTLKVREKAEPAKTYPPEKMMAPIHNNKKMV